MVILEDEGKGVTLPVQVERGFPADVVRQVYRPLKTFTQVIIVSYNHIIYSWTILLSSPLLEATLSPPPLRLAIVGGSGSLTITVITTLMTTIVIMTMLMIMSC